MLHNFIYDDDDENKSPISHKTIHRSNESKSYAIEEKLEMQFLADVHKASHMFKNDCLVVSKVASHARSLLLSVLSTKL